MITYCLNWCPTTKWHVPAMWEWTCSICRNTLVGAPLGPLQNAPPSPTSRGKLAGESLIHKLSMVRLAFVRGLVGLLVFRPSPWHALIACEIQIEGVVSHQSQLHVKFFIFMVFARITYHKRHDLQRIKPSEERFNSSMGKIIVRPDFMSEEWRVKLLQKDAKNHSCRVWGTIKELAPTSLACAIFEAKCNYLIFLDGENVTSPIPVLPKPKNKKASVLSRLKVGLRSLFWRPSKLHQQSSCMRVSAHVFLI